MSGIKQIQLNPYTTADIIQTQTALIKQPGNEVTVTGDELLKIFLNMKGPDTDNPPPIRNDSDESAN